MSSWHTSQLTYAFGLGGLLSFYGILSFLIYMVPIDIYAWQRIAIIVFVLITLPFALLIMFVVSRRAKKKERQAEAAAQASDGSQAAVPLQKSASVGQYPELTRGAEETIQFLKSSNLGESGRDAVYSLPWYIVAGAPRAGKSSLVISSNLNFQTLPSQRQSEQRYVHQRALRREDRGGRRGDRAGHGRDLSVHCTFSRTAADSRL